MNVIERSVSGSDVFGREAIASIDPGGIFMGQHQIFYNTHILLIKVKNNINWLIILSLLF